MTLALSHHVLSNSLEKKKRNDKVSDPVCGQKDRTKPIENCSECGPCEMRGTSLFHSVFWCANEKKLCDKMFC